ncbi:MAG: hypothetical protein D6790_10435 [Caldilineae bacterium]|nr:MAG: hypothetical protein D6790_10435 [Caldilineae bacterium]
MNQRPPKQSRTISLATLAVVIVLLVVIYARTGTLPTEVLEAVLGEEAVSSLAHTSTPEPTEAARALRAAPAETPTTRPQATPTPAPTALPPTDGSTPAPQADAAENTTPGVTPTPKPTKTPTATRAPPTATPTAIRSQSGLPIILWEELPPEAQETIRLIDQGGPFPFRKDGSTFQNREGLLPPRPRGYYREYTVITPGSRDRGARRIVAGAEGELYYTDDHYASFREVIR